MGLHGRQKGQFKAATDSNHALAIAENLPSQERYRQDASLITLLGEWYQAGVSSIIRIAHCPVLDDASQCIPFVVHLF
uniref:Uncharacterized protein n=1 Tax=Magnetococcus massalia (strain MO-1) TaxID=451514 RepID=A0A1S7LEG4_MAGMO|nr:Protein of unknown function [Candidatus Magnetococcus massalia]